VIERKWALARRLWAAITGDTGACGKGNQATREAWLKDTLAQLPAGQRILDAGAGELRYRRFCSHLDYVSQDFAQYDGRGDGIGLQTGSWDQTQLDLVCDIVDIPVSEASFDAVMCVEVLEHLPDPVLALRELTRILKPGGTLIVTAPFCSMTHYAPYFFYTGYSRYFYEHWLAQLGYEIEDMQWNGNYFEYLAQELRRLPSVSQEYTGQTIGYGYRFLIALLISLLARLSHCEERSHELLCYGLHVRARKGSERSE
jgi:SAM-dependent methyltransferase